MKLIKAIVEGGPIMKRSDPRYVALCTLRRIEWRIEDFFKEKFSNVISEFILGVALFATIFAVAGFCHL